MSGTPEMESPPVAPTTEGARNAAEATAKPSYAPDGGPSKANLTIVAYRAPAGRLWKYRGKRGLVLAMLAKAGDGITQWDTLPWHTRLGASIHAMREDGLEISTELEGEYRHARYRLHTDGDLIQLDQIRDSRLFMASENSQ